MRKLIRPALFWVARIGLFLAVVAWAVGQWWTMVAFTDPLVVIACPFGWVLSHEPGVSSGGMDTCFQVNPNPSQPDDEDTTNLLFVESTHPELDQQIVAIGLVYSRAGSDRCIAIHHWLVVTAFALFYGGLKWVYRKRPEVADE